VLCAAASVVSMGTWAQDNIPGYPPAVTDYDPREVALLPRFCTFTQLFRDKVPGGNNTAEVERWYAELGPTFHHLHHYCWGLMKTNRATLLARSGQVRQFYLGDAIKEYDYVIERAPPTFVLLPEILMKRGMNLVQLKKGPVAVFDFKRAIELNPQYWPPYGQLADYYKDIGNHSEAREVLEEGLKNAPNAVGLTRRLAELSDRKK
jgi:tetratricopeptide (TPR) repeat protein